MKKKKERELTAVQKAYFTLLERVEANSMNGAEIVADLLENRDLWDRVIPGFTAASPIKEFLIREAFEGDSYLDTIFIKLMYSYIEEEDKDTLFEWIREEAKDKLTKLTRKWKADEIEFIEIKGETVLRVWFD